MNDKERIEVYVNELPAQCLDCRFAYDGRCQAHENGEYYCVENCRRSDCPLKTIQSVQNQNAVEALKKVKGHIMKDVDHKDKLERKGDLSEYGKGGASRNIIIIAYINQLIREYGGKDE